MAEEEQVNKWRASTAYIEPVVKLLRSLQLNRSQAHLKISSLGVQVQTFAASRTFNSQLFLDSALFANFEVTGPDLELRVSLHALVHCLQMFMEWSSTEDHSPVSVGCFFDYSPGQKLQVSFACDTLNSVCGLTVYEAEGNDINNEITFNVDQIALQVILPASVFTSVLGDLEAIFAKSVSFLVNLEPPQLEVRGVGEFALTEFVLPNEPNVLDAMAAESKAAFSYDFSSLAKSKEAVKLAKRVSLRFDSAGVLSVQCLCEIDDHSSYIELRFLSSL